MLHRHTVNVISSPRVLCFCILFLAAAIGPVSSLGQAPDSTDGVQPISEPDTSIKEAPYVPTERNVVDRMLRLANVSEGDVVYDLGSGDGRIVIAAAKKFGARAVGVEIDPDLVKKARAKARESGVADRVEFRQGDLFETDLTDATVVTLYLWPDMNNRLRPKLQRELDPGDRVVSNSFDIDEWRADSTVSIQGTGSLTNFPTPLYLWKISESTEAE